MIVFSSYKELCTHISTLQEISGDTNNNVYMTDSIKSAVSFDKVKEEYIRGLKLSDPPKSVDALFDNGNGSLIFIEFKNGKIKANDIYLKIYDSILILSDITSVRISDLRKYAEYILVYNENKINKQNSEKNTVPDSQAFNKIKKTISRYSNSEIIIANLKRFENYCFKRVHTYTQSEFSDYLKNL